MVNWGIIGFGRIARKFTECISYIEDANIVAIGSRSVDKNDPYLLENPSITVYEDYIKLLNDKNVEAVYIAVPHKFHKEWVIQALNHKKAVLCEKPAVLTTQDMIDIKECVILNQTCFLEALKTKINDGMDQLKHDIALIGKIETIEANFCSNGLALKGTNSFLFDKQQGGALNDVGPYLVGFTLDLIDAPLTHMETDKKIVDGIDEHFIATLTFANEIKVILEGAIDENKERFAFIKGKLGSIKIPLFNRIIDYTITLNDGSVIERHYPLNGNDMTKQIVELQQCLKQGLIESPRHTLDQSIEVISLIEKIRLH